MDQGPRSIVQAPSASAQQLHPTASTQQPQLKKKRIATRVACDSCRSKRCACDGQRPACGRCTLKELQCVYDTSDASETRPMALKRKMNHLHSDFSEQTELLECLKSIPEKDAFAILRRLRASEDISTLLSSIRGSMNEKYRPSEHTAARSTLPATGSNIEFELNMRHQKGYPVLLPLDTTQVDLEALFKTDQPPRTPEALLMLNTDTAEVEHNEPSSELPPDNTEDSVGDGANSPLVEPPPSPLRGTRTRRSFRHSGPYRARPYLDDRLHQLRIGYWTKVPISDDFAASAISLYLEVDHPIFGWFDANIFLEDLVKHRQEFCSPFLVSSLLYYSCQTYTAIDVKAAALSQAFFAEAELLWKSERASDSLTSVAAMQIFSLACSTQGKDDLAVRLAKDGRSMAERLELFSVMKSESMSTHIDAMSPDLKRASAHTAWGVYNWLTFRAFFHVLEPIAFSPPFPIPGETDMNRSGVLGIEWPSHALPHYMGGTFTALCSLWTIAQEVVAMYLSEGEGLLGDRISLAFAESIYNKLLACVSKLPSDVERGDHSNSHTTVFHIFFHFLVTYIFRPFTSQNISNRLLSFSSLDSSPETVFNASIHQLKRLLLHRMDYPAAICCTTYCIALAIISTAILGDDADPDWRFYFLLCMRYCQELYIRYPVYRDIMQGFLALAIQNSKISSLEAMKFSTRFMRKGKHHNVLRGVGGDFTIDFGTAITKPDHASASVLAQQFKELTLLDEYIETEYICF